MNLETTMLDGRSIRANHLRQARKSEILKAAEQVIAKRGYPATSITHILEATGISRGTFYLYFESRESLFQELIDGLIAQLMDCIQVIRPEEGRPIEDLYENVRRVVNLLFDHRELATILFREAVGQNAQIDQKLNRLYGFLYRMVCGALRSGVRCGLVRDVDERVVAMAIIGSIKEVLYQYLVVRQDGMPDRETIAQELLSFGLQGLKP